MRKILLSTITLLLLVLVIIVLTKGINIGNFEISSIKQIDQKSQDLNNKIEEVNKLIDVNYPQKITELKTASKNMQAAKSEYLKYTNLSTDEDILAAMGDKTYAIEFLWTKLGVHARQQGVNLKFELIASETGSSNVNDLAFTVNGSYIAITNFIYAIENDSDLNFRIQSFKLLPYEEEILQGTFIVRNISIQGNTSTQSLATSTNSRQSSATDTKTTEDNTKEENEKTDATTENN